MTPPQTTGAFLKEKMTNLQRWAAGLLDAKDVTLRNELLGYEIAELEAVLFAQLLAKHKAAVEERDWQGLREALEMESSAIGQGTKVGHFATMLRRLSELPQAQDKFWRYMELFVMCVA